MSRIQSLGETGGDFRFSAPLPTLATQTNTISDGLHLVKSFEIRILPVRAILVLTMMHAMMHVQHPVNVFATLRSAIRDVDWMWCHICSRAFALSAKQA